MVALSFYGICRIWEIFFINTHFKFFAIISFALLLSNCFNLHVYFRLFRQTIISEIPSLIRKEKITRENCGTLITRNNNVRHKKSCSAGTMYCIQCHIFSTKSQSDLNYHIAKKHSASRPDVIFEVKRCNQEFPGFYALRQHRNTQHRMQIGSRTRNVDGDNIVGDVEGHSLRVELRFCQHSLVDSELESSRHKVFNYAVESINETIVNGKLDQLFQQFEMCSKSEFAI